MSNAESANAGPALLKETAERLAEQSPSLGMPRLVAIENMQNILADQRKRVRDSHRVQMAALGHKAEEGDEMGINVAGDTHITITQPAEVKGVASSMLKKCLPWIAGAMLPLLGFAAAKFFSQPSQPPAAVSPSDSEYEIRFFDKDGKLIDVPRYKG